MLAESGVGGAEDDREGQGGDRRAWACSCARWSGWTARPPSRRWPASSPGKTLTANQIEFVNLIVDHLTEHGVMDAALLYESPFTDLTPQGPDGLFTSTAGGRAHGGARSGQGRRHRSLSATKALPEDLDEQHLRPDLDPNAFCTSRQILEDSASGIKANQ